MPSLQPPGHIDKGPTTNVDGLEILQRPQWQDYPLSDTSRVSIELIGRRIIVTRNAGFSTEDSTEAFFKLLDQIIQDEVPPDTVFALVQEWSGITGATLGARTCYITKIRAMKRLKALIFVGVAPKFRMSIMLARRFRPVNFPVLITKNLDDALARAMNALGIQASGDTTAGPQPSRQSDFPWSVTLDGFRVVGEVIEGDLFHTISYGYLRHEHVDAISAMRRQIVAELGLTKGFSGIIADVRHLEGSSRKGRRKYTQDIMAWHRSYPMKAMVYYGANRLIRAGVVLAGPFMPFGLRVADTLEEAVALVKASPEQRPRRIVYRGAEAPELSIAPPNDTAHYAQQIVDYLAAIQWEEDGVVDPAPVPPDHPFADVFDTIALIKAELDDLFREQRIAETEKEQLHQQLQQAHKMESVGTLAGGISHDFNNILGIIQGNIDMALDEAAEGRPLEPYLEEIRTACQRGTDVVSQLLHFARDNDPARHPVNLSAIVRESMNLLRATIPASIRFDVSLPERAMIINAMPTQIHQMIINMCTNAAHAMEAEGGLLSVALRHIDADGERPHLPAHLASCPLAVLRFEDTGHGIAADIIARIFDPYFTTKPVGRGTGLGLSVVHGIVTSHGGHIQVESQIGGGTRFTVWLPLTDKPLISAAPDTGSLPRGTEHVLIVDDEIALVRLTAQLLGKLGYRVDAHTTTQAALAAFEKSPHRYSLVITDMEMPDMTGTMLAERIRAIRSDVPIIMCTGFSETFTEEDAAAKGFKGYLMKPLDRYELAQCVRCAIDETGAGPAG